MNCPNCNQKIKNNGACPHCGYDETLMDKMTGYSNVYYNRGLRHARNGDLTNAIDDLLKSVGFSKKNIDARNLLGLVYYQIGLMGDSVKHWVLSIAAQKENNDAERYLDEFQRSPRKMEQYADSLRMYNAALSYLSQNSEDMAIIQLKKALDYNGNFVDAMNLLALCYLTSRQRSKAVPLIDKVLELDVSNPIAMNYLNELSSGRRRTKQKSNFLPRRSNKHVKTGGMTAGVDSTSSTASKNSASPFYSPGKPLDFSRGFPFSQAVCIAVGALISAIVMYMLVLTPKLAAKDDEMAALAEEHSSKETAYATLLNAKDIEIAKIKGEKNEIALELEELESKTELQDRLQKAQTVGTYYTQGRYLDAITLIDSLNTEGFPQSAVSQLQSVREDCYKSLGETNFNNAKANYNDGKYDQAKAQFEAALKYVLPNSTFTGDAYYFLGRIAEISGDIEVAVDYFKKTVDGFPDALNYDRAVNKINTLSK